MPLKAVLFDLDRTLWYPTGPPDFDHLTSLQLSRAQPTFGADLAEPHLRALIVDFWQQFPRPEEPYLREIEPLAVTAAFLETRLAYTTPELTQAFWTAMVVPSREFGYRLFDDTLTVLALLKQRGLRLGVVTNRFYLDLEEDFADFPGLFDTVVYSGDVGFRKPHPIIFEEALRRLDVSPAEALMVGDGYDTDVVGALKAGITAVLKLNDQDDLPEWQIEHKIRNLGELVPLLEHWH